MSTPAPVARPSFFEKARKFLVAAAGVVAMVAVTKGLEEDSEVVVNAILGILTAAGVYATPNRRENLHDPNLRAGA